MLASNKGKHYRSNPDVIAEILTSCEKAIGKTRVMYMAFLSSSQTQEYLSELVAKGLLTQYNKTYQTTKQGLEFLKLYSAMKEL